MPDLLYAEKALNETNFNAYLLIHEPRFLSQFTLIGGQEYYISHAERSIFRNFHSEWFRVGAVREAPLSVEPYLREAHFVSWDACCIRASELADALTTFPGGFFLEEACQLARFAGASLNLQSFGIYNFTGTGRTPEQMALIGWYFIDGLVHHPKDVPASDRSNLHKEHIFFKDQAVEAITFYQHIVSGRWWMEVQNSYGFSILLPVSYYEVVQARQNEIPKRWWNWKLTQES